MVSSRLACCAYLLKKTQIKWRQKLNINYSSLISKLIVKIFSFIVRNKYVPNDRAKIASFSVIHESNISKDAGSISPSRERVIFNQAFILLIE